MVTTSIRDGSAQSISIGVAERLWTPSLSEEQEVPTAANVLVCSGGFEWADCARVERTVLLPSGSNRRAEPSAVFCSWLASDSAGPNRGGGSWGRAKPGEL